LTALTVDSGGLYDLSPLGSLVNLENLDLRKNEVILCQIDALRDMLPGCLIRWLY